LRGSGIGLHKEIDMQGIPIVTSMPVGKYAQMRLAHLKKHLPEELTRLKEAGKLERHLKTVQQRTVTAVERLIHERLEAHQYRDPNSWEERMQAENMARLMAEEVILPELVLTPSEIVKEQ
jgi:hypothetical protein